MGPDGEAGLVVFYLIVGQGLLRPPLLRQEHADVVVGDGVGRQELYRPSVCLPKRCVVSSTSQSILSFFTQTYTTCFHVSICLPTRCCQASIAPLYPPRSLNIIPHSNFERRTHKNLCLVAAPSQDRARGAHAHYAALRHCAPRAALQLRAACHVYAKTTRQPQASSLPVALPSRFCCTAVAFLQPQSLPLSCMPAGLVFARHSPHSPHPPPLRCCMQ
jgi:hypothetical protein